MTAAPLPARRESVVFRATSPQNVQLVELLGDLVHWRQATAMTRIEGRTFEATSRLREGTYEYKFRLRDGTWFLDTHNPRTRALGGNRNSLLVVGGCDEPVLHAPVPPYVHVEDDGRVCIRAGLRKGAGERLVLRWDEGHGPRRSPMLLVGEEDEHLLFQAHAAGAAPSLEYLFQLPDGRLIGRPGGPGMPFSLQVDELRPTTPAWWKDAVLYTVFVDRFRRGGPSPWPLPSDAVHHEETRLGGDLAGVLEALPYLRDLGVTVIHLTPVVLAGSCHHYDAVDPRSVDPVLGGQEGLARLLDACHLAGLRVLFDITLTHVHRSFAAFQDVVDHGDRSPYWDWFRIRSYPFRFGPGVDTGYEHYQKGRWQEPLLRLESPEVVDYLASTVAHWARAGVDGFRFDAAADVPLPVIENLVRAVRSERSDALLLGEVTVDNTHAWTRSGLDAVTDFQSEELLYDLLWRKSKSAAEYARQQAALEFRRPGPGWRSVVFSATHDQPRLLSLTRSPGVARLGHLLVLMRRAVPALYYGDEIGLSSEDARDFEGVWPDRAPMIWGPDLWDQETLRLVRQAVRLRGQHDTLRYGEESFGTPRLAHQDRTADEVLWLRRTGPRDAFDLLVHTGDKPCVVALPPCVHGAAEPVLCAGEAQVGVDTVELGPCSAVLVHRVPASDDQATLRVTADHGEQLVDLAFREGLTEALCLPKKLYLTVTERCNLDCLHCINHSPARTRDSSARDMPLWVMERLEEALAVADYVAFSHGGESLVSPGLFELLRRIQRVRASRPGRPGIHLLTNGMLLTPDRLRSLVDLGVTSLAVSVDGPTAATNDTLRRGSRLDVVLRNVREACRLRDLGADLRIGLSTVLGTENVMLARELGQLALDLGVDWLKVEEMVPVNGFARRQALRWDEPRLVDAIVQLRAMLDFAGVMLVNHLRDPVGCDCHEAKSASARAFRKADDFANRARFLPCRMPWDTACVDPDGTVHPVSYDHPAIGSLLRSDLLELWDGEAARRVREEALRRYPPELRARCPVGPYCPED